MVTNDNGCALVVCLKYFKITFSKIRGRVFVFPKSDGSKLGTKKKQKIHLSGVGWVLLIFL